MASRVWNDINLPGIARSKEEEKEKPVVTGVEDNTAEEEPEDEVRIISAEWVPGSKGFQYDEQCFCDVNAEYLKETSRAKLRGNLHGIFDGIDEDMRLTVEGCIDDTTMIARLTIQKLHFINNDHYTTWQKDGSATCQYYLKDISHSLGVNKIDSPMLDMPNDKTAELHSFSLFLEMVDPHDPERKNDKFTLYSTDLQQTYEQTKTISDDAVANDNTLELIFTDLDENLSYTLELDAGDGSPPVIILRNRAYGKWTGAADGLAKSGKDDYSKDGGLFKKIGDIKGKVSQTKSIVNDKIGQANELKQSAANKVNEVKSQADEIKSQGEAAVKDKINQANEIKQNATNQVNEARAQANDIKSQGEAAVKDKVNQANEIKQNATNQVNDVKAQVNDIKSQGEAAVKDKVNQTNKIKQSASDKVNETKSQATGSLKDKLAAINSSREIAQKAASAAKEKTATANTADNVADSLKSVPKFTI